MLTARHINKLQDDVITVTRLLKNLHQELEDLKFDVAAIKQPELRAGTLVMIPDPGRCPFWAPAIVGSKRRYAATTGKLTAYHVECCHRAGDEKTLWVPVEHVHEITAVQSSES